MRSFIFLSALIAASPALAVPIHGCENVPNTTAVTDFTLFDSASADSALDYVTWQVPALSHLLCHTNTSYAGNTTATEDSSTRLYVSCTPPEKPTTGVFLASADDGSGRNASLEFITYAQCAADIYEFHWKADFLLSCAGNAGGDATCVSKGNASAMFNFGIYLPPVRSPPPPSNPPHSAA